jgi:hypothetical protein
MRVLSGCVAAWTCIINRISFLLVDPCPASSASLMSAGMMQASFNITVNVAFLTFVQPLNSGSLKPFWKVRWRTLYRSVALRQLPNSFGLL